MRTQQSARLCTVRFRLLGWHTDDKKKKTQNVKFLILSNKIEKKTLMTVECRSLRYEIRPYSWRQSATWQNVLEYCKIKLHFPETLSINMGASRMLDNERYENEMIQKSWDKTNLEKNSHQVEKIHTNQRFEIFRARYGLLINFDVWSFSKLCESTIFRRRE